MGSDAHMNSYRMLCAHRIQVQPCQFDIKDKIVQFASIPALKNKTLNKKLQLIASDVKDEEDILVHDGRKLSMARR